MSIWHQIAAKFQWQSSRIATLEQRIETMSAELDALLAANRAIHDAVASAVTKLKLLSDEVARLKAGATDVADVAIAAGAIHAEADTLTSAIAAAVV